MQQRAHYIMHDQVRNQVGSIMAWQPHSGQTQKTPLALRLLTRGLNLLADTLFKGLHGNPHATRAAH